MAKKAEGTKRGSQSKEPASFEKALAELQDIVRELESGEQSLDDSLKLYERGIASLRTCHTLLDQAEQRIRKLVAGSGGKVSEEPFESEFAGETLEIPAEPGDISTGPTQVLDAVSDDMPLEKTNKGKPGKAAKRGRSGSGKGSSLFSD